MKQRHFIGALLAFTVMLSLTNLSWAANTNADYAGVPPTSGGGSTVPNVLLLMDNSSSLGARIYCPNVEGTPGLPCSAGPWDAAVTYEGLFISTQCYQYSTTNTRFAPVLAKAATASCPAVDQWDGNFMNWVSYRRIDAIKKAMIGGECAISRAADGTCPVTGNPLKKTIRGSNTGITAGNDGVRTSAGVTTAAGRVPDSVLQGAATLYFTMTAVGHVFIDDDATLNADYSNDVDPFVEKEFDVRLTVEAEPLGVIQQVGSKARLGLMVFRDPWTSGGVGGKVIVPIGTRQSVSLDSNFPVVKTFTSNQIAMVTAVQTSQPIVGDTQLGTNLYTALTYIAQAKQPWNGGGSGYAYPIAFSPDGAAFATAGPGSIGPGELTVLATGENCPAGYISKACGRDPYFFGTPWASPSTVAGSCCKTFILIVTDGLPTNDAYVPTKLQDYAHGIHKAHCSYSGVMAAPMCQSNATSSVPVLLGEHNIDYKHYLDDVAYWGHSTDLRQATIPGPTLAGLVGHDIPGIQTATIYTFNAFAGPAAKQLLMETAKQGAFDDLNGDNKPDKVGQNCTDPNGVAGISSSEWDTLKNATGVPGPDCIPDAYYEANSDVAGDFQAKLSASFNSILQRAGSGSSSPLTIASTSGEGAAYQAYYYAKTPKSGMPDVTWTGFVQGFFVDQFGNLREDSSGINCTGPPDGKLILRHDCIIKLHANTAGDDIVVDRYIDDNGDGIADSVTPLAPIVSTGDKLSTVKAIWEGGRRLALTDPGDTCANGTGGITCRRILTWVDLNNDGLVTNDERIEFQKGDVAKLCPYLGGTNVLSCNLGAGQTEAANVIDFIRGYQVAGMRDRQLPVQDDSGGTTTKVWKLGDIMNSSPVVVAGPSERYDVIYGDPSYATFFLRYKDRRRVAYAGGNDGMLHAFNAGFYSAGDVATSSEREQLRFTTLPKKAGTNDDCGQLPCDNPAYPYRSDAPKLGAELWGFIPQDLLPQLRWLTDPNYSHVYYVDLKPKITDARIFPADADHPGGWGTVLIGGFRLGGSCGSCVYGKGYPRTVTADFNGNGTTTDPGDMRVFLSSYFVLDITNPEKDPVLLWTFRDGNLGLTTALPAVIRLNPAADAATSGAHEKWYVAFGTGATDYDYGSNQSAQVFIVDLKAGPTYYSNGGQVNQTTGTVQGSICNVNVPCLFANDTDSNAQVRRFFVGPGYWSGSFVGAFMGDLVTVDLNLDYRVDVLYVGSTGCISVGAASPCLNNDPLTQWKGGVWRLTTNGGDPNPDTWGVTGAGTGGSSGRGLISVTARMPSSVITKFSYTSPQATTCVTVSPCYVGPVASAPTVSTDDDHNLWLYFGTGRFYSNFDKGSTALRHFLGVKDCIPTGVCSNQALERSTLVNVSSVVVCTICNGGAEVTGLAGVTNFNGTSNSLVGAVATTDGWFTTLPTTGEGSLTRATVFGGIVFFSTYAPSTNACGAGGTGRLYALYYQTGTAYKASIIGTATVGSNTQVLRSADLGAGTPSEVGTHIGAGGYIKKDGTETCATSMNSGNGSGGTTSICIGTAKEVRSRNVAWRDL